MPTRSGKHYFNTQRTENVDRSRTRAVSERNERRTDETNTAVIEPRLENLNIPEENVSASSRSEIGIGSRNHHIITHAEVYPMETNLRGQRRIQNAENPIARTIPKTVNGVNLSPIEEDAIEVLGSDLHPAEKPPSNEVRSETSRSSIATQKRRLELRATEERIKIRRTILAERERAEIELINSRLELELAELEDMEDPGGNKSTVDPGRDELERRRFVQEWLNNPTRQVENPILPPTTGERQSSTELRDLTQAITKALESTQKRNPDDHMTHRLVSRLTSSRDLPSFDGDPLDWPRFKRAFESSTKSGGFSEQENVTRLYNSLRKETKDAVAALMITSNDVSQIMRALELRFGNPDLVAQKVIKEMKRLQKMSHGRGNLVVIATTVQNGVAALQSINHLGYLHSPELGAEILSKIPENLIPSYNCFNASRVDRNEPRLVTISKFLVHEAETACEAGTVELTSRGSRQELTSNRTSSRRDSDHKRNESPRRDRDSEHRRFERTLTTMDNSSSITDRKYQSRDRESENRNQCRYCKHSRHFIDNCSRFSELPVRKRWEWVKESGVCFKCLTAGHSRSQCTSRGCSHPGCQRPHHILLHSNNMNRTLSVDRIEEKDIENQSRKNTEVTTNTWTAEERRVLLKVAPVRLEGPRGYVDTYALLDGGSTITLIDATIAKTIGAEGKKCALHLIGANEMESSDPESELVEFTVRGDGVKRSHQIAGARTVQNLHLPCQSLQERDLKGHRHLDEIRTRCYSGASPKLLIGQDHWDLITPTDVRGSTRNAPVASFTKLGWVVHGHAGNGARQSFRKQRPVNLLIRMRHEEDDFEKFREHQKLEELHTLVKTNFTLEGMGVTSHYRKNSEDQRAEKIMSETTRRFNERWETGLLWRNDHTSLPDSRMNAYKRLMSLECKMRKDPTYSELYKRQMGNFIEKGYAKKVTDTELGSTNHTWYLPHFGVVNPNKPGKIRLVFDAAAKSQGTSLNDTLLNGPDLLRPLPGVLMKFRQRKIAFTADIQEMFLQVKIIKEDQDAQLFLWREGESHREPDTYCMTSMIFGARSSPSSAQYVKNRNAEESGRASNRAMRAIQERHYVDDYLDSVDDEKEAIELIKEVIQIHRKGGFELRGWNSNSSRVLRSISHEQQEKKDVSFTPNDQVGTRILGLKWYPTNDTLSFAISTDKISENILNGSTCPSKREVLRILMSVFDPLGFLTPYTVRCKILLQKVWRRGIDWDESLTGDLFEEWNKWVRELTDIPRCLLPRCYTKNTENTSVELHIFCDASEQAMAAVAYWRFVNAQNTASISFIMGRSRVAPLKPLSIPRMELQAAVIATRLAKVIEDEHEFKITQRVFWTDSRVVWHWITGDARTYKSWVANRLGEIDDSTNAQEWRWVPTKQNPADEATRNVSSVPSTNSRWFQGAAFLQETELHWPRVERNYTEATDKERKIERVHVTMARETLPLPDISRFSLWMRLIRSTAWILLTVDKCIRKTHKELGAEHLSRAQILWVRKSQTDSFQAE